MKPAVILPLALVLAFLIALPVSAAPPVIETGSFTDDFLMEDPAPCPGIEIWDRQEGVYQDTYFFDNQGNLLRIHNHWLGSDTLYNPANPGVEFSGQFSFNHWYDALTGQDTYSGNAWNLTAPGYGGILKDVGHFDTATGQFVGRHDFSDPEALARFCAIMVGG